MEETVLSPRADDGAKRGPLRLVDVVRRSLVLCYREDVAALADALRRDGLSPQVLRARYSAEEQTYSRVYRCFLAHRNAWRIAAESDGWTLICEADFVPCAGLGGMDVFWPADAPLAYGYLYQGSPRLLWLTKSGHLRGHAAPTVAYVIDAAVARVFLDFFDDEMSKRGPRDYFTFEAHLQWYAMGRGVEAYIPLRHYGEHGGVSQPEHRRSGQVRNVWHRADNLQAPLAFLPQYAEGNRLAFYAERLLARAYGFGRLLTGRWICPTDVFSPSRSEYLRMQLTGLRRLF